MSGVIEFLLSGQSAILRSGYKVLARYPTKASIIPSSGLERVGLLTFLQAEESNIARSVWTGPHASTRGKIERAWCLSASIHWSRWNLKAKKETTTIRNRKSPLAKTHPLIVAGIDLAGSPRRPTGLCVLRNLSAESCVTFNDDEILDFVMEARPARVPIDAPLSLPNGRLTVHDRSGEHLRECDRELLRRGVHFFPVTLGPMRMLTERGLSLKGSF